MDTNAAGPRTRLRSARWCYPSLVLIAAAVCSSAAAQSSSTGVSSGRKRVYQPAVASAPAGAIVPVLRQDPRTEAMRHADACLELLRGGRTADALVHLHTASTLLVEAGADAPRLTDFAYRWHVALAVAVHGFGLPGLAAELRASATQLEPLPRARAREAYEQGLNAEVQAGVAGPLAAPRTRPARTLPVDAERWLETAARHYESAVTIDSTFLEARLHLGRVRLLQRHAAEAEKWLAPVAAASEDRLRYVANMFLGALAEERQQYEDAERCYRAALDAWPWAQAAPLGLAHLLIRQNRDEEARALIARHFAGGGALVDPLWTYLAQPGDLLGQTLDELRTEASR